MTATGLDSRASNLAALGALVDEAKAPLDRLAALPALIAAVADVERTAVEQARAGGASWQAVASRLDRSRQAVQQRFAPRPEPEADGTVERRKPAPRPKRPAGWTVTTPRGRKLLRVRKD